MTGTPCSCIWATSPSVFFASAPSKPGKPHWLVGSVMLPPPIACTQLPEPVPLLCVPPIAGLTYLAPKSPW